VEKQRKRSCSEGVVPLDVPLSVEELRGIHHKDNVMDGRVIVITLLDLGSSPVSRRSYPILVWLRSNAVQLLAM
jgi:hypothetical protein